MARSKAAEVIAKLLRQVFKPEEKVLPSVWVENEIRLDKKTSANAGRYSLRHTPYLRQLYDDLANPRIRKIVLKKSAQIGATQFANNVLLYYVCSFTVPALMILPSKESAQQFCERSLTPTILNCDALKPYLTGNEDDLKKTEFLFTSCIVRVIGAGSPSKLASNPACLCIIDEADKMADFASQGEAPALELAEDRTITFPNDKKILILSTPTNEVSSVVHSQYLQGSQSKYFCPCPKCDYEQTLLFEQVKWPECKTEDGSYDLDRIEREAYYECANPDCKAHLVEQDKIRMVRNGIWKDTNPKPFPAEFRSYHISALYSFDITWGVMAKFFLLAKDDVGKLRNFYNSYLGEIFEQRAATIGRPDLDYIIKNSPHYRKGELLASPDALLMATDTQGDSFWFGVEAIYPDGSCSIIDWGQAATFQDLEQVIRRTYKVKGTEQEHGIFRSLIDMGGNRTEEVKRFCITSGGRFVPVLGRDEKNGLFAPVRETTFDYQGTRFGGLLIHDTTFKNLLYLSKIKLKDSRFYLPQDTEDELKIQLSSERLVEKKVRGNVEMEWKCTNRRNHLGDCFKYIEAFKYSIEPQLLLKRDREAKAREVQPVPEESNGKRQYTLNTPPTNYWN